VPTPSVFLPPWRRLVLWTLFAAGLYAVGVCHWVLFYRGGDFSLLLDDWKKDYDYYAVLKTALEQHEIPYHMAPAYHGTDRYLGNPETNLAPHVLLMPVVGIVPFFLWHTLVMYTLGFLGCLLIARRYCLGPIPFALLFLLFGFNGYITAHLSVGHSMWNGYFLLPFFCLWTLELLDGGPVLRPALLLALVLFAMMLQGSFHHVVWCWMLLGLLLVFNPRLWRGIAVALAFSVALSAFRLGPAAVAFGGHSERGFWAGYANATYLLESLVRLLDHNPQDAGAPWIRGPMVNHPLGWNEYDMYVGLLGLAALVYFGIVRRLRCGPKREEYRYRELDAPLLTLAFLSLNYFYAIVAQLPVPLLNSESVSSRFFIVPLVFLIVLSAIHLQRFLEKTPPGAALYVLLIGGLLQTAFTLAEHSWAWRIVPAPADGPAVEGNEPALIHRADPAYVAVIQVSAVLSLLALAAWVVLMVRPGLLRLGTAGRMVPEGKSG
jgi:hypothetical protein